MAISLPTVVRRLPRTPRSTTGEQAPLAVLRLVDEHLSGTQNRRLLIWSLLNVESFCETFL